MSAIRRGGITHLETRGQSGGLIRARIVPYPISLESGERYGNSDGTDDYIYGPYCCKKCEKPLYVVIDQGDEDGDEFEQPVVLCGQAGWDKIIFCEDVASSVCLDCIPTCNHEDVYGEAHTREVDVDDAFGTVWGRRGGIEIGEIRVVDCDPTCTGECLTDFSKRYGWIDPTPSVKYARKC